MNDRVSFRKLMAVVGALAVKTYSHDDDLHDMPPEPIDECIKPPRHHDHLIAKHSRKPS